jgi:hypothetical protein
MARKVSYAQALVTHVSRAERWWLPKSRFRRWSLRRGIETKCKVQSRISPPNADSTGLWLVSCGDASLVYVS